MKWAAAAKEFNIAVVILKKVFGKTYVSISKSGQIALPGNSRVIGLVEPVVFNLNIFGAKPKFYSVAVAVTAYSANPFTAYKARFTVGELKVTLKE